MPGATQCCVVEAVFFGGFFPPTIVFFSTRFCPSAKIGAALQPKGRLGNAH